MRKNSRFLFCALTAFCFISALALAETTTVSGEFISLEKKSISINTMQGAQQIPLARHVRFLSTSGSPFPRHWLLPGDGVEATVNAKGEAVRVVVHLKFITGTAAFVSPNRITLAGGRQFFFESSTPIYLNDNPIPDGSGFKPEDPVLVRFDPLDDSVAGIWGFDFSPKVKGPENIFKVEAGVFAVREREYLRLRVMARGGGMVEARLPGVFPEHQFEEKKGGEYDALILLPQNLIISGGYLEVTWNRASYSTETWIDPQPLWLYSEPPAISQLEPPDENTISINAPYIFAAFDQDGTPMNPNSIQLFLDGVDVTPKCYRTAHLIFYAPDAPLPPGEHTCFMMGESVGELFPVEREWSFTVEGEQTSSPEKN